MTRKCFFIEQLSPDAEYVTIGGATAHHMRDVLRLQTGEWIELRDGHGNGWTGSVVKSDKEGVQVRLSNAQALHNESSLDLVLAMAFARSDRMELVIRQATELGITRFIAYRSKRSQYSLSPAQMEKRRARWLKIAREAMCQCGRMKYPEIHITAYFSDFILWTKDHARQNETLRLVALEDERQTSLADIQRAHPVCCQLLAVIGPEGGWSAEELQEFAAADFRKVHLGPRILRLETAAIAFVTMAQNLWGDLGARN